MAKDLDPLRHNAVHLRCFLGQFDVFSVDKRVKLHEVLKLRPSKGP